MRNRVGSAASNRYIGIANVFGAGTPLALLAGLVVAGNAFAAPCFSVEGTKVNVNQLFATDAKAHTIDLEDMPSVSTVVSRGSESHNMIFMNVKRDPSKKNVIAFLAKIDDRNYEFPRDSCQKK